MAPSLPLQTSRLTALLACAEAAARAAGAHALRQAHRRRRIHRAFAHDLKLVLDRECQTVAETVIRRRFPDHALLGEESDRTAGGGDYLWIIDPIDGTVNYFHGLPLWCCSVAVQYRGRTVAGAVFAPVMEECYTAHLRSAARCNGRRIAVSATRRLKDAIVATGIDRRRRDLTEVMARFERLSLKTQKLRIMGSAALDICHVARGASDGFYESGIYLWDVAAGALIVERAGGRAEILETGPGHQIRFVATNGHIHRALKAGVRQS